jgi:hypothetical protein
MLLHFQEHHGSHSVLLLTDLRRGTATGLSASHAGRNYAAYLSITQNNIRVHKQILKQT